MEADGPFRMQVSTLAWSDYIGQIGCGRVLSGSLERARSLRALSTDGKTIRIKRRAGTCSALLAKRACISGLRAVWNELRPTESSAGDIVWLAGPSEIGIGDTFSATEDPSAALHPLEIEGAYGVDVFPR